MEKKETAGKEKYQIKKGMVTHVKEKIKRYSSSGSDSQDQKKNGIINCLCRYPSYDPDMLKCVECSEYAHAVCYGKKTKEIFTCAICSKKQGKKTGNTMIDAYYEKSHHTYSEKQDFVFNLNRRRVLNSILNQEFLCCQPGLEPSSEFLKIRFGFSSSYSAKITVNLIKEGLINVYGGFSFNGGRIIEALGLHEDIDEPETDDILSEKETAGFDFGEIYKNSGKSAQKEKDKKKGKRSREVSESEENNGKRTRSSSPIKETEKEKKKSKEKTKPLEIVNKSGTYSNVSTQSRSEEESRWERNNSGTDVSRRTYSSSSDSKEHNKTETNDDNSFGNNTHEKSKKDEFSSDQTIDLVIDPDSHLNQKISRDREGKRYKMLFSWPSRFINSESRDIKKDIPESVASFGKRSKRPVYGQIADKNEPRQNTSDSTKWNLHFILGMEGHLVQCWIFGSETEIKEINQKLQVEEYYLFWGDYNVKAKYSSKFKHTNDWALYFSSKCNKFDQVKRTRNYIESDDSKSEDREIFADKFKSAPKRGKKVLKKKEHNARMKAKLDVSQKKITEFGTLSRTNSRESSTSTEEPELLINPSEEELK